MAWFKHNKKNRIEEIVNRLQSEGKFDGLESALGEFSPQRLKGAELESWHRLYGIAAFRRGDREAAFERFREGHRACPESEQIKFSLGQEYEYRGDPESMLSMFDECLFPAVPASYALAQSRYAYLWGRPDRAFAYVETLLPTYYELGIADDHFLYTRQMPFFSQTWAYLAASLELQGDLDRMVRITKESKSKLSDIDLVECESFLEAVVSQDYSALLAKLKNSASDLERQGFPNGYPLVRVAVIEAQQASNVEEAIRLLNAVSIGGDDFPWLEDIVLLARCSVLSNRDGGEEEKLRQRFLSKQRMLFEPDHAFNFRLLAYQEGLSESYQNTRGTS